MKRLQIPSELVSIVSVTTGEQVYDLSQWLHHDEIAVADAIALAPRRKEWVMARIAAKKLAMSLGMCSDPLDCTIPSRGVAPELRIKGRQSRFHVSISHSHDLAAAAISPDPVGIDIQIRRPIEPRSTRFFLGDEEASLVRPGREDDLVDLWSAKEAALKASGVRLYREVSLQDLSEENGDRSFRFRAGGKDGRVETMWLDHRRVILALALLSR